MKVGTCLLFASVGFLFGEDMVTIKPLGLVGRADERLPTAVVGGEPARYGLTIGVAAAGKISILADIRQVGGKLAAPLQKGVPLGTPEFSESGQKDITVEIPMPDVRMPTQIEVEFREAKSGGPPLAQTAFVVFPPSQPGEFAHVFEEAEKSDGLRLAVFGESRKLRAFFENENTAFLDLGASCPERLEAGLLILGEVGPDDLETIRPDNDEIRTIVFVSLSNLPPGVYRTDFPNYSFTKVTLPLLTNLQTDPQSRNLFLDLLTEQSTNPKSQTHP